MQLFYKYFKKYWNFGSLRYHGGGIRKINGSETCRYNLYLDRE